MKRYTPQEARNRFAHRKLRYPVSAELKEGLARLFGEPLTPEEAVERIVREVEEGGDACRGYGRPGWARRGSDACSGSKPPTCTPDASACF